MWTSQVRTAWADRRCKTTGLASISFLGRGQPHTTAKVWTQPECVPGWAAAELVLYALDYGDAEIVGSIRYCPAGIGGKKCEADGRNCSLHNYCLAFDVDPYAKGNGYIRSKVTEENFDEDWFPAVCKFTLEQVQAVEAIKTNNGAQIFRWLGWAIGDFMHWQINCTRADLATGIDLSTVYTGEDDDMQTNLQALRKQNMAFYEEMQTRTGGPVNGTPGGNASYWGADYVPPPGGPTPTDAEWITAYPILWAGFLTASLVTGASAVEGLQRGDVVKLL